MKTVVGLFDDMAQAKKAALDLEGAGIQHNDISIVANNEGGKYAPVSTDGSTTNEGTGSAIGQDAAVGAGIGGVAGLIMALSGVVIPGFGWIAGAGWLMALIIGAGAGAVVGGLIGALTSVGVPEEDAAHYNEGVRRGGTLLAVKAQDAMAQRVAQILGQDGAVDIDERAAQYRQEGFQPTSATNTTAQPATNFAPQPAANTSQPAWSQNQNQQGETVLPVVEEELQVGKREAPRGGVRVYTHVTEQPVQEQVTLREEHVNVDRRPVDRPLNAADASAFKDQTIEVAERSEEPVISKQARVVEEVVVGKQATERTETVQDTVRRTDVDVQPIAGAEHTSRTRNYDTFESDFRNDYQSRYASQGGSFEQYQPAYRYGYDLYNMPNYRGRDWATIEPEVRRDWESRQPNTWDKFKNSIQYAWERAAGTGQEGYQASGAGDRVDDRTGRPVG